MDKLSTALSLSPFSFLFSFDSGETPPTHAPTPLRTETEEIMVGGFLTRFAAVAAAHPLKATASASSSSSLSRASAAAAAAAAAEAATLPSGAVIQIEYCESCGYEPWVERFRSVISAESSAAESSASSSSVPRPPPPSSPSSFPPSATPLSAPIPVVSKKVRAVGAFEISLLSSAGGFGGGGGGGASSSSSWQPSSSSSAVPLWSKLSTGQPSSVEGVAAVARLAAQEAARAAREERAAAAAGAAAAARGGRATAA